MTAAGPGQVLFGFVRHWSRRSVAGGARVAERGRLVMVTEAVAALEDRAQSPTVNAVAGEIGIDQSGASRLIKSAVDAGLLTTTTTTSDGRRREASVAAAGRLALRDAHRWQEEVFAELTADWSQKRRDEFRDAMSDLMVRSAAIGVPDAAAPLAQPSA